MNSNGSLSPKQKSPAPDPLIQILKQGIKQKKTITLVPIKKNAPKKYGLSEVNEIDVHIASFLPPKDLTKLALVNKYLYAISQYTAQLATKHTLFNLNIAHNPSPCPHPLIDQVTAFFDFQAPHANKENAANNNDQNQSLPPIPNFLVWNHQLDQLNHLAQMGVNAALLDEKNN